MRRLLVVLVSATLLFSACGGTDDPESEPNAASSESEPAAPVDPAVAALQEVLIAAYDGAADYARDHDNYFARSQKERGELAGAVSSALSDLSQGVGSAYAQGPSSLDLCSQYPDVPMVRISVSDDGDDLVLAAADQELLVTLTYNAGDAESTFSEPTECG